MRLHIRGAPLLYWVDFSSLVMRPFLCLIVSYFVLFYSCFLEVCSFLKSKQRSGSWGEKRWEEIQVEEGKLFRGCIIREKDLFLIKRGEHGRQSRAKRPTCRLGQSVLGLKEKTHAYPMPCSTEQTCTIMVSKSRMCIGKRNPQWFISYGHWQI